MKHVLVLDSHNSSVPFLQAQKLKHPGALQNFRADSEVLAARPDLLQSKDGIQFYHFTQKFPATNAGHFTGFEHIDRHLEIVKDRLARINKGIRTPSRQERLDAIVIPDGILEKPSTFRWLERMREEWPGLQILVTNPTIHPRQKPGTEVYVQTFSDEPIPAYTDPTWHNRPENIYKPLTPHSLEYHVHPAVTWAIPNCDLSQQAGLLRKMLGMPPLGKANPHR